MPVPDVILSYVQYIVWPFALTIWMGHPILVLILVGLTQLIMWAIAQSIGNKLDYWLGQPVVAVLSVCFAMFLQWVLPDPMRVTPLRVHVVSPNPAAPSFDDPFIPEYKDPDRPPTGTNNDAPIAYFTPPYVTDEGLAIPIEEPSLTDDIEAGPPSSATTADLMGEAYRPGVALTTAAASSSSSPLPLHPLLSTPVGTPSLPSYVDRSRSFLGRAKEVVSNAAGLSHSALDRTLTEIGRSREGGSGGPPFGGHDVRIDQLGQTDVTVGSAKTYPMLVSVYLKERDIAEVLSGRAKLAIDEEPRRLSVYGSTRLLAPLTPGHEYLFIAAAVHLSLLVGASVLWEHYPMPDHVWGPVSMIIAQLLGIAFAWVLAIQNRALMLQPGANVFFAVWLVVSIVIPSVFFLDFADVHERWVAVIAVLFAYPAAFATFTVARLIVWEANKKGSPGSRITVAARHPAFRERFVPAVDVRVKT